MGTILILAGIFLIFSPEFFKKISIDHGSKMLIVGFLLIIVGIGLNEKKSDSQNNSYRSFDTQNTSSLRTYEDGYSLAKELGTKDYSECYLTNSSYYEGCAAAVSENIRGE